MQACDLIEFIQTVQKAHGEDIDIQFRVALDAYDELITVVPTGDYSYVSDFNTIIVDTELEVDIDTED